jgi:hypothetical protein
MQPRGSPMRFYEDVHQMTDANTVLVGGQKKSCSMLCSNEVSRTEITLPDSRILAAASREVSARRAC